MRKPAAIALSLMLAACATSSGEPATGFMNKEIARAYIPLEKPGTFFGHVAGAGVVIYKADATIAVTNAHNYNLVDRAKFIMRFPNKDLMFFYADRGSPPRMGQAYKGEPVRAYGQGADEDLREATGKIVSIDAIVPPLADCTTCQPQHVLAYEAPAGPGFSGGPLVDAKTGALIGITFAYYDDNGKRIMYAYDINMIVSTLNAMRAGFPSAIPVKAE